MYKDILQLNNKKYKKRFKNGLPPPREWLAIYQSQKTVQSNRKQYVNNRIQEIRDKENIQIGQIPLRKGPEKRVEEYIDPKTGFSSGFLSFSCIFLKCLILLGSA